MIRLFLDLLGKDYTSVFPNLYSERLSFSLFFRLVLPKGNGYYYVQVFSFVICLEHKIITIVPRW